MRGQESGKGIEDVQFVKGEKGSSSKLSAAFWTTLLVNVLYALAPTELDDK